jgi:hypothetical protein
VRSNVVRTVHGCSAAASFQGAHAEGFALRHRIASAVVVTAAAATIAACGGGTPSRDAPEGSVVEVGGIAYQVQFSRELNPDMGSDHPFFAGVPDAGRALSPSEVWLGVFVQGENVSKQVRRASGAITVADAFDHVYRPVRLPAVNDLAYRANVLLPGQQEPSPDGPAGDGPEQGGLLLFHIPENDYVGDRPFELRLAAGRALATVQLDI